MLLPLLFGALASAVNGYGPPHGHGPPHGYGPPGYGYPGHQPQQAAIDVSASPQGASVAILPGFVSFSIEFAFFPDYAGNLSDPNIFSNNLLNNLGNLTGTKPYIRVGGNTQDYAVYQANLTTATYGIVIPSRSPDYPYILSFGPSFFESYLTWPDTKYVHGFNLGKNSTAAHEALLATVPLVCTALENGRLLDWELGNEPDLYKTSAQGAVRPPTWTEQDYVNEWLNLTRAIRATMAQTCPNLTTDALYKYYAPSFAGTNNALNPIITWHDGLDTDHDIAYIDSHNYISGATSPGVTLQGTLMNHTKTISSIAPQLNESRLLANYSLPFILGETNSLYNQGRPGLSNTFGAALWGLDFNLWCAANNILRVHMHQGTNYRYQSWQPVQTADTIIGTKAPYYGNIAVAAVLGNLTAGAVQIANLPLPEETEAAYAAYVDGALKRLLVVNMLEYNYTNPDNTTNTAPRPSATYAFQVPSNCAGATVQRLMANGSDAITGIEWDGYSYNWDLDLGRPVRLSNVTTGESVCAEDGRAWGCEGASVLSVEVPYSSAAILNLEC